MKDQHEERRENDLDEEFKIYDFSHYSLPVKAVSIGCIFYNNVNGLEINAAINTRVTNERDQKKLNIL